MQLNLNKFAHDEKGSFIIIAVFLFLVVFGILSLTVDLNKTQTAFSKLQNSADSTVLDAADWISKARKKSSNSATHTSSAKWLPSQTELLAHVSEGLSAKFNSDQTSASIVDNSIETSAINYPEYTDVTLKACATVAADISKANGDNSDKKVCAESVARIYSGILSDKEIMIAYNSTATMPSWPVIAQFKGTLSKGGIATTPISIFRRYLKDSTNMRDNNLYVGLIPYSTFVNLYPFSSDFIKNYSKQNLQYSFSGAEGSHPQISYSGSPADYEVMRDLGNDYPVFDDSDFNNLIDNTTAGHVSSFKFNSHYKWMRYDKDPDDGNLMGKFYEDVYPAVYKVNYDWEGGAGNLGITLKSFMTPNCNASSPPIRNPWDACIPYIDGDRMTPLECNYSMPRQAIADIYSHNFVQPLTNSFEAITKNLELFSPSGIFSGDYCGSNTDYKTLADSLPSGFVDKYFDCQKNVNDASTNSANPYLGLLWGWMSLSDSFKGKWNQRSVFEKVVSASVDRSNVPEAASQSGRQKVLIVMYDGLADSAGWASRPPYCDSYEQFTTGAPTDLVVTTFDVPTNVQANQNKKPTNYANYNKLCNKIKEDGVEIYMINYSNGPSPSENYLKACATDSSHYYIGDLYSMGTSLEDIFSNLTTNDRVALIK